MSPKIFLLYGALSILNSSRLTLYLFDRQQFLLRSYRTIGYPFLYDHSPVDDCKPYKLRFLLLVFICSLIGSYVIITILSLKNLKTYFVNRIFHMVIIVVQVLLGIFL